jgi:hypothetical protein
MSSLRHLACATRIGSFRELVVKTLLVKLLLLLFKRCFGVDCCSFVLFVSSLLSSFSSSSSSSSLSSS